MSFQRRVARFFLWILRLLLCLLPRSFRRDYGEELLLVFRDLLKETERRSWFRTAAVALGSLCDIVHLAIREHWETFLNQHNLRVRKRTPCVQAAKSAGGTLFRFSPAKSITTWRVSSVPATGSTRA